VGGWVDIAAVGVGSVSCMGGGGSDSAVCRGVNSMG
jgi:hypothetical protein